MERYSYTPYGLVTVRAGDTWNAIAGNVSQENNTILYTGRTVDLATGGLQNVDLAAGLMYYRARFYDAVLERFIHRDPIGYGGGINLYEYVGGSPDILTDPFGLCPAGYTEMTPADRQDFHTRVVKSGYYTRNDLAKAYPKPDDWDWKEAAPRMWTKRSCNPTGVLCVAKAGRYSQGDLISTTPTGTWEWGSLTAGTLARYLTGGAGLGSGYFNRTVNRKYQKLEEWDILLEYNCNQWCKSVDYMNHGSVTSSNYKRYVYKTTAKLVVPNAFITVAGSESQLGTTWMDPETGDVRAKDPAGKWHEDVQHIEIIHAGG